MLLWDGAFEYLDAATHDDVCLTDGNTTRHPDAGKRQAHDDRLAVARVLISASCRVLLVLAEAVSD